MQITQARFNNHYVHRQSFKANQNLSFGSKKDTFSYRNTENKKGFFNKMQQWSKPYSDGDGKLSAKEGFINFFRGFGAIVTEACSTPKKLAVALGVTALTIGTGVGMVVSGIASAPAVLVVAGLISAVTAYVKVCDSLDKFFNKSGIEKERASAYFLLGEALTDVIIAALAFSVASSSASAIEVASSKSREAVQVSSLLADNGSAIGAKACETIDTFDLNSLLKISSIHKEKVLIRR